MRREVFLDKYDDSYNPDDKANGCYFLYVGSLPSDDWKEDYYFSFEIANKFNFDYLGLAKKHGGFLDRNSIFFPDKKEANKCRRKVERIINETIPEIEITKTIFEIKWECPNCKQKSYHYTEISKGITHSRIWAFCPRCTVDIEINIYPSKSPISMKIFEVE